jgi:hypothetical protein
MNRPVVPSLVPLAAAPPLAARVDPAVRAAGFAGR